jgi:hypothetical protein
MSRSPATPPGPDSRLGLPAGRPDAHARNCVHQTRRPGPRPGRRRLAGRPPRAAALPRRRTGEQVDILFAIRARRVSSSYLNNTVIPMLCRKAGVPAADGRTGRLDDEQAALAPATAGRCSNTERRNTPADRRPSQRAPPPDPLGQAERHGTSLTTLIPHNGLGVDAFGATVVIFAGQGGADRVVVESRTADERVHVWQVRLLRGADPLLQPFPVVVGGGKEPERRRG